MKWLLVILILATVLIAGCTQTQQTNSTETNTTTQNPLGTGLLTTNATKNNQFSNGYYVNNYYTYTYNCDWSGLNIKCDGQIQYIGPSNVQLSNTHLDLWCVDNRNCIIGTDQVNIGSVSNQVYTLSCDVGVKKDVQANLEIRDAVSVYMNPPQC